jgi:hypothetical protein
MAGLGLEASGAGRFFPQPANVRGTGVVGLHAGNSTDADTTLLCLGGGDTVNKRCLVPPYDIACLSYRMCIAVSKARIHTRAQAHACIIMMHGSMCLAIVIAVPPTDYRLIFALSHERVYVFMCHSRAC